MSGRGEFPHHVAARHSGYRSSRCERAARAEPATEGRLRLLARGNMTAVLSNAQTEVLRRQAPQQGGATPLSGYPVAAIHTQAVAGVTRTG